MTADVDKFAQTFRAVISPLITAPVGVLYYTLLAYQTLGWMGPLAVGVI